MNRKIFYIVLGVILFLLVGSSVYTNFICNNPDVVNYILDQSAELKTTYYKYQELLQSIKEKNYNDFLYAINNINNNISDYMKTSIKTLIEFKDNIQNTFNNNYHNAFLNYHVYDF